MGNCIDVLSMRPEKEEEVTATTTTTTTTEEKREYKGRMRIKVVLTKEELQWLMEQIKEGSGGKSLEELLEDIERGRGRGRRKVVKCIDDDVDLDTNNASWRPSLESIIECPEVPDQMQR